MAEKCLHMEIMSMIESAVDSGGSLPQVNSMIEAIGLSLQTEDEMKLWAWAWSTSRTPGLR